MSTPGARPRSLSRTRSPALSRRLDAPDSGGGFLPDADEPEPPRALPPPAPIADPAEQPRCLDCDRLFPQSYLFDTFGYNVCDECRSVGLGVANAPS